MAMHKTFAVNWKNMLYMSKPSCAPARELRGDDRESHQVSLHAPGVAQVLRITHPVQNSCHQSLDLAPQWDVPLSS